MTAVKEIAGTGRLVDRFAAFGPLAIIAGQLALLVAALYVFAIQEEGFLRLAPLLFGGFLVNAILPLRLRPPFFLLLSFAALAVLWGWSAIIVVAIGMPLIGIVHLPIGAWARAALLGTSAATVAAMTTGIGSFTAIDQVATVAPAIGSIFMFRLIIYFYQQAKDPVDTNIWQRLSYFFMLPNAAFFLFPVIDFRNFVTLYYHRDEVAIYQRGIALLFRGAAQLVIYRALYYYIVPNAQEVINLSSLVQFMLGGYLLYIKVVGIFHLVVGSLCLFGFDVPSAHHKYLLASGFNDLWRRARTDWKDFMTKVFYYPMILAFKHRGMGTTAAIVVATTLVFVSSWLLHSYQSFWLLGSFPLRLTDFVFWMGLGALVVANSLLLLRVPRRVRRSGTVSFSQAFVHAAKVSGVLATISLLWSFWYSRSPSDWLALISMAEHETASGLAVIVALVVALLFVGAAWQSFVAPRLSLSLTDESRPTASRIAITVGLAAAILVGLSAPPLVGRGGDLRTVIGSLRVERLTTYDELQTELGYYDALTRQRVDPLTATNADRTPPDWVGLSDLDMLVEPVEGIVQWRIRPSVSGIYKRAYFQSDSWGLRDGEYSLLPPPDTFRAVLVGSSYEMGEGVTNNQVFETLAEARLNSEFAKEVDTFANYEILNFSTSGQTAPKHLARMDEILRFSPDLLIYAGHTSDEQKTVDFIASYYGRNDEPLPAYLSAIFTEAGIDPTANRARLRTALAPYAFEILTAIYRQIVEKSREAGVLPIWVLIPRTTDGAPDPEFEGSVDVLATLAREAGFLVFDLSDTFFGQNRTDIRLAPWDNHPNPLGQRLLADVFYNMLIDNSALLGLAP